MITLVIFPFAFYFTGVRLSDIFFWRKVIKLINYGAIYTIFLVPFSSSIEYHFSHSTQSGTLLSEEDRSI
jgi:hypothetical protein